MGRRTNQNKCRTKKYPHFILFNYRRHKTFASWIHIRTRYLNFMLHNVMQIPNTNKVPTHQSYSKNRRNDSIAYFQSSRTICYTKEYLRDKVLLFTTIFIKKYTTSFFNACFEILCFVHTLTTFVYIEGQIMFPAEAEV